MSNAKPSRFRIWNRATAIFVLSIPMDCRIPSIFSSRHASHAATRYIKTMHALHALH